MVSRWSSFVERDPFIASSFLVKISFNDSLGVFH
jgi:hypothetical protein